MHCSFDFYSCQHVSLDESLFFKRYVPCLIELSNAVPVDVYVDGLLFCSFHSCDVFSSLLEPTYIVRYYAPDTILNDGASSEGLLDDVSIEFGTFLLRHMRRHC